MAQETIFSKILRKEIPADVVYEDDHVLAFRDINPQAPTHILVIPKKPLENLDEAEPEDAELMGRLFLTASKVASDQGLTKSGYRVVVNNGRDAGQEVAHIHLHVLGGRRLTWPPG